ncbi:MAG: hypothetical protein ACJA2O_000799 [Candidatus Azotimanducaceae bacterium]|jgi:hypothetical protein
MKMINNFSRLTLFSPLFLLLISCENTSGESPQITSPQSAAESRETWNSIKSNAAPSLQVTSGFTSPTRLANVSTLAWEDGLYVSDDGLHLFAFYAPFSLFKFQAYVSKYPYRSPNVCAPIADYIRGPILDGSDFELEAPYDLPDSICNNGNGIVHSEIAHASRASVKDDFSSWSRHELSNDFVYDGGFSSSDNGDGTYNLIYSQSSSSDQNDIYWVRNATSLNPSSATPVLFSKAINTKMQEDNPHLERIGSNELILLFDNHHEQNGSGDTHISYSTSTNNGETWRAPKIIESGTINDYKEDITGHLYEDESNNWWLYFVSNRAGKVEIWRIQHTNNQILRDFDNWNTGSLEKVIGVKNVARENGTVEGVGEPSLTSNGDLHFAVIYCKNPSDKSKYDGCDIDPWVAKKK